MKPKCGKGPPSLAALLALIAEEQPAGLHLLDVGCGTGDLTIPAAALAGHVTGIDRDEAAVDEAGDRSRREGVANVTFLLGDAEEAPYETLLPEAEVDMVVAYLGMSDAIVARAADALRAGRCLIFACFHTDHWRETGVVSRFAYDEERLRAVLEHHDLGVEFLAVEQEVRYFASSAEARRHIESSTLKEKFRRSARWENLEEFYRGGGRTFTRSICVAKARKR